MTKLEAGERASTCQTIPQASASTSTSTIYPQASAPAGVSAGALDLTAGRFDSTLRSGRGWERGSFKRRGASGFLADARRLAGRRAIKPSS